MDCIRISPYLSDCRELDVFMKHLQGTSALFLLQKLIELFYIYSTQRVDFLRGHPV